MTLPDVADIEDNPGLDMKAEIHIEIEGDSINYDTVFIMSIIVCLFVVCCLNVLLAHKITYYLFVSVPNPS